MKFKISFLTQWGTPFGAKGVSVRVYGENFQLNHSIGNRSRLLCLLRLKIDFDSRSAPNFGYI